MADDALTVSLDGENYNIEDFELGDLEWLEDEMGAPLDQIEWGSARAAVRLVYLIKRRTNPNYTLDDARGEKLAVFTDQPAEAKRPPRKAAG